MPHFMKVLIEIGLQNWQKKSFLEFRKLLNICELAIYAFFFDDFFATTVPTFFTTLANFDFWLEALFLWMTFFLANLSSIEETSTYNFSASDFSVEVLCLLINVRVVFA